MNLGKNKKGDQLVDVKHLVDVRALVKEFPLGGQSTTVIRRSPDVFQLL